MAFYNAILTSQQSQLTPFSITQSQGTNISDAWGSIIGSSTTVRNDPRSRIIDLSGVQLDYKKLLEQEVGFKKLEPLDKASVDSAKIVEKYKEFTEELKKVKSLEKTLETELDEFTKIRTSVEEVFSQLFSGLAKMTTLTPTEFNDFMDKKKEFIKVLDSVSTRIKDAHVLKLKEAKGKVLTLNDNLADIRQFILEGVKLAYPDAPPMAHGCPVCYEKESNICIVPCGHTLCEACADTITNQQCPSCRIIISSKVKLFFS